MINYSVYCRRVYHLLEHQTTTISNQKMVFMQILMVSSKLLFFLFFQSQLLKHHNVVEILIKLALSTNQSVNCWVCEQAGFLKVHIDFLPYKKMFKLSIFFNYFLRNLECYTFKMSVEWFFFTIMKRKFKLVNNSINKMNNNLSPYLIEHKKWEVDNDMTLVLAWDRHKNVVALNWLMGSQPSPLNWISYGNTYINPPLLTGSPTAIHI